MKVARVFIANVMVPNAFAFGSPVSGRRIAITSGLLSILTRDEIDAVLGYENSGNLLPVQNRYPLY